MLSSLVGVSGSGSATGELEHCGSHPRPQVADRGMPSRMDKRVHRIKKVPRTNSALGAGKL